MTITDAKQWADRFAVRQRRRSAMPTAAVANASHVPPAKAAAVATSEASHVPPAKAAWMAAKVMFLPGMVVGESRPVPSSIDRPSIGVGSVAIAWIVIGAISRSATSAHPAA
jgi:hypothetical protein